MKFGVIVRKGQQRKALPIIEAASEDGARYNDIVVDAEVEGFEVESIRDITDFPLWNNCLYSGLAVGHTVGQCTANACY